MSKAILELIGLKRSFGEDRTRIDVLTGLDFALQPGEIVGLVGPSGSGKSTLLHITGLLEQADQGKVLIDGQDCFSLTDKERTRIRRFRIGFVYQFHHLLPEFTAIENILIPQRLAGTARDEARDRAKDLLDRMGLADRGTHLPSELSGGEQQRVAFARAMANRPAIMLADEPTGNLDPQTSDKVFAELLRLAREEGLAALIATHNHELARRMDRVVTLDGGKLRTV